MQHKKAKQPNTPKVQAVTRSMVSEGRGEILSDILGSYTGTGADGEMPEQDADDL